MKSARKIAWRAFALVTFLCFANGVALVVKELPRAARGIHLFHFSLATVTVGVTLVLIGFLSVWGVATALYVMWNPAGDEKR